MTAKWPLVNRAIIISVKRHSEMLEFDNDFRCHANHELDRILITEPIGAFHRIVHMPKPVILSHVAQGGANPALRSNGV